MNKLDLQKVFVKAKTEDARFIGVAVQTEGSSRPEIIINPMENFSQKYDYYMEAYDDDLILISAKGKKDIRIIAMAAGKTFEDIQCQIMPDAPPKWKKLIADAINRSFERMMKDTPPQDEEERMKCEAMKEAYTGMFINDSRTAAEARFIEENIDEYERIFDICMSGDETEFKNGLIELQKRQNEFILAMSDDGA